MSRRKTNTEVGIYKRRQENARPKKATEKTMKKESFKKISIYSTFNHLGIIVSDQIEAIPFLYY